DPALNAAAVPLTAEQQQLIVALEQGTDPLEDLDPTAAVLQGGGSGEGGSFTRVAAVIETTSPLALQYPRPGLDYPETLQQAGGTGTVGAAPVAGPGAAEPSQGVGAESPPSTLPEAPAVSLPAAPTPVTARLTVSQTTTSE